MVRHISAVAIDLGHHVMLLLFSAGIAFRALTSVPLLDKHPPLTTGQAYYRGDAAFV